MAERRKEAVKGTGESVVLSKNGRMFHCSKNSGCQQSRSSPRKQGIGEKLGSPLVKAIGGFDST